MGSGGSNKTFFNIYSGSLVVEKDKKEDLIKRLDYLNQPTDKILTRQRTKGKNEGKDVYYHVFNDVGGKITNVGISETDFGENVFLELTDVDEVYKVSLGDVFGRHSKDFIRRIEHLDLLEEVTFGTWTMVADNGKTYSGVRMYQDGKKVEYVYDIKDLPPPTQKQRGKKTEWDFADQEAFLYNILEKFIRDNFKPKADTPAQGKKGGSKSTKKTKKPAGKAAVEEKSDLPWE